MSSPALKLLETEMLRLESAHKKERDPAMRRAIAGKILENCKRLTELERRYVISNKINPNEWSERFERELASIPPPPPPTRIVPLPRPPSATTSIPLPVAHAAAPASAPVPPAPAIPSAGSTPSPAPPALMPAAPQAAAPLPSRTTNRIVPRGPVFTPRLPPPGAPGSSPIPRFTVRLVTLERQTFDPARYAQDKKEIESFLNEIVTARGKAPQSPQYSEILARAWKVSVKVDDEFESHRKLNG